MKELSDDIIKKFLTDKCTEEELLEISTWIKASDENARRLFSMEEVYLLGKYNQKMTPEKIEQAERRLYERLEQKKIKVNRRLHMQRWMKYTAGIAAIVLFVIGINYWNQQHYSANDMMAVTTSEGGIKEINLPDGTKVWLNNNSTLRYPGSFSEKERTVFLSGEAYFMVTKNQHKPFVVQSDAMQVRVLGTTFNFKCDNESRTSEVSLIEGEVEVKGNKDEGLIILSPGQRAELDRHSKRLIVRQVDTKLDAVWHDDLIPFEKANIFTIAKVLERFYNIKIILSPDIHTDRTYSGMLKRKENIESVLQSLQNSIPIKYKIVGNNLFIYPENNK